MFRIGWRKSQKGSATPDMYPVYWKINKAGNVLAFKWYVI